MNRSSFWCRVIGWVQIAGGLATALVVWLLWAVFKAFLGIPEAGILVFVMILIVAATSLPGLLAGALTLRFAAHVAEAEAGQGGGNHALLRVLMVLAGLWAAGALGFAGLSVPPLGFFCILALATVAAAFLGADGTANILSTRRATP